MRENTSLISIEKTKLKLDYLFHRVLPGDARGLLLAENITLDNRHLQTWKLPGKRHFSDQIKSLIWL